MPAPPSSSATGAGVTRPRRSLRRSAAGVAGGCRGRRVGAVAGGGRGRHRHPRQQRGDHPRRLIARMSDEDWRDGARDEPLVDVLHLPGGGQADDEAARRRDREHLLDRRRPRQSRARRTTPRRRPGSSASQSRWRGSSAAGACGPTSSHRATSTTQLTDVLPDRGQSAMLGATPLGGSASPPT